MRGPFQASNSFRLMDTIHSIFHLLCSTVVDIHSATVFWHVWLIGNKRVLENRSSNGFGPKKLVSNIAPFTKFNILSFDISKHTNDVGPPSLRLMCTVFEFLE